MTQSTEQERAEFEAVASDYGASPKAIERDAKGNYLLMHTATGWMWWQAARRAPAVPQGWKLVPEESTDAMARAFRADDAPYYFAMTTIRCNDFAERWRAVITAAPQPPEATVNESLTVEVAQVQMPEPAAWVYNFTHSSATGKPELRVESITTDRKLAFSEGHSDQFELYTEHQVRQLLASHGIK